MNLCGAKSFDSVKVLALCADKCRFYHSQAPLSFSIPEMSGMLAGMHKSFPDFHFEVKNLVNNYNSVSFDSFFTGTHTGSDFIFPGNPNVPTSNVAVNFTEKFTLFFDKDNKITNFIVDAPHGKVTGPLGCYIAVGGKPAGEPTFNGQCFCGKVSFTATGLPNFSAFCTCSICRRHHSSDRVHISGFSYDKFSMKVANESDVKLFSSSENEDRYFCTHCGTKVYSKLKKFQVWATFPSLFEFAKAGGHMPGCFVPRSYLYYGSICSLGVEPFDSLTKFDNMPVPLGGTGAIVANY